MADLSAKIKQARDAGYDDAEIASYLSEDATLGGQIGKARESGYSDGEVLEYLSASPTVEATPTAPAAVPVSGAATVKPKRNVYGEVAGAMANFNRGLGIGDEIVAGARTVGGLLSGSLGEGGLLGGFRDNMAAQRQTEDSFALDRPNTAGLLKGTGMAATALAPGSQSVGLLASSPRWLNIGRGAVTGALSAAGYGALDRGTVSERLGVASDAATDPLVLGLGAAGGALGPAVRSVKAKRAPAPELDALKTSKNQAYAAVDSAGIRYSPQAMDDMIAGVTQDVQGVNISKTRHPKAYSMLEDLQAMKGRAPTLTELDQLRQVIRRDVASATDPAEAFFGQRMIRQLDGFIDGAGPDQVISGSATDAARMLRNARDLNTRVRKIEGVNDATEKARLRAGSTGSGGNVDNATRQELRRVLEKTPNLTDDEATMLEQIVIGSKGQNALRQVGKLSPQGNGLMTALSIGGAAANPLLAIPTAAGAVSKVAADRITQTKVKELVELIARGGSAEANMALRELAASNPEVDAVLAQVSSRLSKAGGVAGAPTIEVDVNRSTNPEFVAKYGERGR